MLKQICQRGIVADDGGLILIVPITSTSANMIHRDLMAICFGHNLCNEIECISRNAFDSPYKLFKYGPLGENTGNELAGIFKF